MLFVTSSRQSLPPGRLRLVFVFTVLCLLSQTALAAGEVRHTVSFPKDKEQVFLVRSEFPVSSAETELIMPDWTPGSYLIRDHAVNINRISATAEDGSDLTLQKISKDRWQVNTSMTGTLVVEYEVIQKPVFQKNSWFTEISAFLRDFTWWAGYPRSYGKSLVL